MKKIMLLAVLVLGFNGIIFAQQTSSDSSEDSSGRKESDYYYVNVPLEKIYAHRLGYVVLYRQGFRVVKAYLPISWFNTNTGKGEAIFLNSGSEWPSMTVYYKEGAFSHVRLRMRRNRGHESWGVMPFNVNIDDLFNVEEVKLQL